MLTRSTPMKRTGFKSRAPQAQNSDPDRVRSMPAVVPGAFRAPVAVDSAPAAQVEKAAPVRNEAYRRLVAAMPCVICGMVGYGQAAHGSAGKGMGIKASDLELFCLCADRPGVRGCHSLLDQGALFTKAVRRELEPVWAADTQRRIQAMGLWPKNMQKPAQALGQ